MRHYGIANPIHLIGGLLPVYFSVKLILDSPCVNNSVEAGFWGLVFALFFVSLTILFPLYVLSLAKFIIVDNEKVTLIYLFRLTMKEFPVRDLKSVYRQLNNSGRIEFKETCVYFGQERRFSFNHYQILNFKALSDRLETIEQNNNRPPS